MTKAKSMNRGTKRAKKHPYYLHKISGVEWLWATTEKIMLRTIINSESKPIKFEAPPSDRYQIWSKTRRQIMALCA